MSAHLLLNLLKKLGEKEKIRGLSRFAEHFIAFSFKFYKFNIAVA